MKTQASLAAGLLTAFGATACCSVPLLLVTLGFGGVWAARMERLNAFQPYFVGLTVLFMGFAFHRLYLKPRQCEPGEACELPQVLRRQRILLWVVVGLIAALAVIPLLAPYFY